MGKNNFEKQENLIPSSRLDEKEIKEIDQQFADNPLFSDPGKNDTEYFRIANPGGGWFNTPKRSHMDIEWEDGKNEHVPIKEIIAARLANPEIIDIKEAVRSFRRQNKAVK